MLSAKKTASEQVLYISNRITEHNHLVEAELYPTYPNVCQSNNSQCAQPEQLVMCCIVRLSVFKFMQNSLTPGWYCRPGIHFYKLQSFELGFNIFLIKT